MDKTFSIIIPVYNEEKRIGKSLDKLFDYLERRKLDAEVIVVDDGSTDHTLWVLKKYLKKIRIIPVSPNQGKGNAIKTGMMAAGGDLILFMDADLATPLSEFKKIIHAIEKEDVEIAIGSRNNIMGKVKRTPLRFLAGKVFSFISQLLVPLPYRDTQCGFKLFQKEAAKEIFLRTKIARWAFDIEVLFLARHLDYKIAEMPVKWQEMKGSKVKILRDAFLMVKDLMRIRFYYLIGTYSLQGFGLRERNYPVLREGSREIKEL